MPKKHLKSYLDEVKFDPKLATSLHARYFRAVRIIVLLVLTILFLGTASYISLPRRLNPEVKIPIVVVNTILPGASSADVESLVTKPVEDAVSGVSGIDTVTSVSRENASTVSIQFLSSVDRDKAREDVQTAVNAITDLPTDAKTPSVIAVDFENQPIWTFALSSTGDEATLMRFAHTLESRIKDIPSVNQVSTSGLEHPEIQLLFQPEKLREYQIDPQSLIRLIKGSVAASPAGNTRTDGASFALTIDPSAVANDDLRSLIITVGNRPVKLSDIAIVIERSKPEEGKSYVASSKTLLSPAVTFSVFKTKSANITSALTDVKKQVEATVAQFDGKFHVATITNTGEEIDKQSADLVSEFGSTVLLLFVILLIFLGLRQALIVSFTVPLTFLVTFTIMSILGITINFLSLFSLLLALGLLVDDAIVIVSAMTAFYRTGRFTPFETALLVWRDFIVPIWTTTITTVWAFIPLLLSTGIIGEFIKTIPIVVATAMYSSTAIAVLINLPLMMVIMNPKPPRRVMILLKIIAALIILAIVIAIFHTNPLLPAILVVFGLLLLLTYKTRANLVRGFSQNMKQMRRGWREHRGSQGRGPGLLAGGMALGLASDRPRAQKVFKTIKTKLRDGFINIHPLSLAYKKAIADILNSKTARRNVLVIIIAYTIFSYVLLPLGFVVNEFFPKADQNFIYLSGELPAGTQRAVTTSRAQELLQNVENIPEEDFATAEVGKSPTTGFASGSTGDNLFLITIVLRDKTQRHTSSNEIARKLRNRFASYPYGKLSVVELSGGPPAGADVQIQLLGDDLVQLDSYAETVMAYLKQQPGLTNIDKSIKGGTAKLSFVPDQVKMAQAGVTADTVAFNLRSFASGLTIDTLKRGDDKVDIVFRMSPSTPYVETIGRIMIPTKDGAVPLLSLGRLALEPNPTVITREKGKRTISVSASIESGYSVSTANKNLETFAKTVNLSPGYSWKTGGVNEENQKSVQSILVAMVLATILITATMVIEFNSYRKAVIVLLVIPIAISSVFLIFALTGTPLSFPALIGVLALFGIVVTHGMVVMEKINQNQRFGMRLKEAISDACASRLEPILLTTSATIIGLVPITISNPLWRGLGGAIIAGMLFSGLLKLFFIPVVYYEWYKGEVK